MGIILTGDLDLPLLECPAKAISGNTCLNTGHWLLADARWWANPVIAAKRLSGGGGVG